MNIEPGGWQISFAFPFTQILLFLLNPEAEKS
jgi:hypothetical protein